MKITRYVDMLTRKEGKKKSIDRAQAGEYTRILRENLLKDAGVDIYAVIRKI